MMFIQVSGVTSATFAGIPMVKQADGTFTLTIDNVKPKEK